MVLTINLGRERVLELIWPALPMENSFSVRGVDPSPAISGVYEALNRSFQGLSYFAKTGGIAM